MKLFDGVIKLPNGLKGKPIKSIEDLKQQIKEFEKEKSHNEKLLPIAKDLEKHQKDLEEIKKKTAVSATKTKRNRLF